MGKVGAATAGAPSDAPEPSRASGWQHRARAAIDLHPVRCSGVAAAVVALVSILWLWSQRSAGLLDADESRYIADALRFADAVGDGPAALIAAVGRTSTAPLVPLMSLPFTLLGIDRPLSAFLIQPVLLIVSSCCIASITAKVASPRFAVGSGVLFSTSAPALLAVLSYQYGLAVVAFAGVALAALLSSDRGTNRRIWWVGPACAAMMLSRTMALAFLPALAVASFAAVWPNRHGVRRLVVSLFVGVLIAAPWYLNQREAVFEYLFEYGYGERSGSYGPSGLIGRLTGLVGTVVGEFGVIVTCAVVVGAVMLAVRAVVSDRPARELVTSIAPTPLLPLAAFTLLGAAVLLTSSNRGSWFATPLLVATIPLGAAIVERAGRPTQVLAGLGLSVQLVAFTLVMASWVVPSSWLDPVRTGAFASYSEAAFSPADQRFEPQRRLQQSDAAAEWVSAQDDLTRRLRLIDSEAPAVFAIVGDGRLLNSNAILVRARLDGWLPDLQVVATSDTGPIRDEDLDEGAWNSDGERVERILVVIDRPHDHFPANGGAAAFTAEALDNGWSIVDRYPIEPGGGSVSILRR